MRLTPAVGGILPRIVLAPGATITGVPVPAGMNVGVFPYVLHRNPDYFMDPHDFRPGRWIAGEENGTSAEDVKRAQNTFFAFSQGAHSCLGKHMAYVELSLAVVHVVWLYDWELSSGLRGGGLQVIFQRLSNS